MWELLTFPFSPPLKSLCIPPVFFSPIAPFFEEEIYEGFPGGAVVENPPANAEDTGSSPGLGGSRIPHAAEQLGPWATTTEPARLEPVLCNKKKAAIVRGPRTAMKSGPHLPKLEKALTQKQRPNTAKNK